MNRSEINVILIVLGIIVVVTLLTAALLQSPLLSNLLTQLSALTADGTPIPVSAPTPEPAIQPLSGSGQLTTASLESAALGIAFDYPVGWRRRETSLYAIVSPSANGLDPENLSDSSFWIGISAEGLNEPIELLNNRLTQFAPTQFNQTTLQMGGKAWETVNFNYTHPTLGQQMTGIVAASSHNEVGYYLVATASADQWQVIDPTFQNMLGSVRFLQQAVLRPTDATPPPTPTATPTPVIYIIQSGDTPLGIALKYGVTLEALRNRNGLDENSIIRAGQPLVIPVPRR